MVRLSASSVVVSSAPNLFAFPRSGSINDCLSPAKNLLDLVVRLREAPDYRCDYGVPKFGTRNIGLLSAAKTSTVSCHYTNKNCSEELLPFIHGSWLYGFRGADDMMPEEDYDVSETRDLTMNSYLQQFHTHYLKNNYL